MSANATVWLTDVFWPTMELCVTEGEDMSHTRMLDQVISKDLLAIKKHEE